MAPRSVLVTGMSGLIGGALRRHLEGKYALSALNRQPVPGVPCHRADIADLDAIAPAFEGVDTVVYLAARTGSSESFDEILGANVIGTYNVFEAAPRGRGRARPGSTAPARSGARRSRATTPTATACRRSASGSAAGRPRTGRGRPATTQSGAV